MYFVPEGQHDSSQARSAWTGVWTFQEGKTTRQPEGGMAPSRLYHRRPACVLVSAPTATLPSPGRRRLLLVRCEPRFCQHDSIAKIRIQLPPLWRSKLAPAETQAGRLCYFGLTAVPTS